MLEYKPTYYMRVNIICVESTAIIHPLTLGGVVLAANSKLAFPAGLYCGESLKSAGELAAEPPVPPLLSIQKCSYNKYIQTPNFLQRSIAP